MLPPRFTDDVIVRRLRRVMSAAMLFSFFITLASQPRSFWLNPETAIRGDGLSIHDPVNHTFEFFLGNGWQPFLAAFLIYFVLTNVTVGFLPRKAALIVILSVIFGHFYGATNWLAVRWQLGFTGVGLFAVLVSSALVFAVSAAPHNVSGIIARRIRWLMVAVMLIDPLLTLIGQPASYWLNPERVHEGNPFWRWVMQHGWFAYVAGDLIYCAGAFLLASSLPGRLGWICGLGFIFGHFVGGSNWLFYEWRLGMDAPVIYGIAISASMVWLALAQPMTHGARDSSASLLPKPCG